MSDVNVTELRQNLPAYLAQVQRGRRLRVTSRGQVIAEIGPPAAEAADIESARSLLRGSVAHYERPFASADAEAWEVEE